MLFLKLDTKLGKLWNILSSYNNINTKENKINIFKYSLIWYYGVNNFFLY